MRYVYIVFGSGGYDSNPHDWEIKAYLSEESAVKHLKKLRKQHKKWMENPKASVYRASKKFRALDPHGVISESTDYDYYLLELLD